MAEGNKKDEILFIQIDTRINHVHTIAKYPLQGINMLEGKATDCVLIINGQPFNRVIEGGTQGFIRFMIDSCKTEKADLQIPVEIILGKIREPGT
jgi:hypothetical protein